MTLNLGTFSKNVSFNPLDLNIPKNAGVIECTLGEDLQKAFETLGIFDEDKDFVNQEPFVKPLPTLNIEEKMVDVTKVSTISDRVVTTTIENTGAKQNIVFEDVQIKTLEIVPSISTVDVQSSITAVEEIASVSEEEEEKRYYDSLLSSEIIMGYKESSLEFLDSQTVEVKTPQELIAETPAETKPETPDFSALAAGDYVAFIQSKGNFPPKFYISLRDVLIDMSVLDRPEIISDKLIRIDPAFGVMFEEVLEMQKQPGFLAELIAELDAGTLGQPVQQPVKNMRQAAVHTKRQKHQQRGKHSYE